MPIYTYKLQKNITGTLGSSVSSDIFSLNISSVNANKVTSYEIKFLNKDTTVNEYSIGYFRGQVINTGTASTSYSTNKDTSFIYNSSTVSNIYISNTIANIYDTAAQTFEFKLTNSNGSTNSYNSIIYIEINFKI